jgi:hypothetical protein
MARNGLDLQLKLPSDAELNKMFNAVPTLERYKVGDKAIRAGVKPIVKRARQLAPRDRVGHGKKRSKKQQAEARWDIPLWKTISHVVRKYDRSTTGVVGPKWPDGNKAYFNTAPGGRRVFYWGKDAGKKKAQVRNWIVEAFDETRSQQLAAMKIELQLSTDAHRCD